MKKQEEELLRLARTFEKLAAIYDGREESTHNAIMSEVCKGLQRVCEILAEQEEAESE